MRIGIDARFYGAIGKGLGRYTQKLIENLQKTDTQNEYYIFLREENFDEFQPKNKNFQKVLADYQWYSFPEQINMPKLLNKYKLDLVHFPHFNVPIFYRKKFIVTIHDLILVRFPTIRGTTLNPLFYWLKFLAYKIVINSAIKRAKKIIAVSQFTKNDILKHYKIAEKKIAVTYEACDEFCAVNPSKNKEEVLTQYGIINPAPSFGRCWIKPYIIYIGNVYPHKNAERLALGFGEATKIKNDLNLVFIGGEDYFYSRLKNFVKEKEIKNIIFFGFVPDSDQETLIRNAVACVRPSLYEGFELPPLEAMAKGTPVICSDHNCAREILGDSVYYFDGLKTEEISKAIIKITTDENLRRNLIIKGYEQIKKYSWKKMAQETLKIYIEK